MTDQYGERGPWHSCDETPEIDGVYEREFSPMDIRFSMYKKGKWYFSCRSVEQAYNETIYSQLKKFPWRGLANKP